MDMFSCTVNSRFSVWKLSSLWIIHVWLHAQSIILNFIYINADMCELGLNLFPCHNVHFRGGKWGRGTGLVLGGSTEDMVEQCLSFSALQSVSVAMWEGLFQRSWWWRDGLLQVIGTGKASQQEHLPLKGRSTPGHKSCRWHLMTMYCWSASANHKLKFVMFEKAKKQWSCQRYWSKLLSSPLLQPERWMNGLGDL